MIVNVEGSYSNEYKVEVWPHCGGAENEREGEQGSKGGLDREGREGTRDEGEEVL